MKLADLTLGLHYNAWAVLHMLAGREADLPDEWRISTAPWYNGRERGFTFTLSNYKKTLHIAVFEHRNSDSICALRWEVELPGMNPPSMATDGAKAYPTDHKYDDIAHSVRYDEAGHIAAWVEGQFTDFAGA